MRSSWADPVTRFTSWTAKETTTISSQLIANSTRFVIRAAHDCCLVGETEKLKKVCSKGRYRFKRTVQISRHDPFLAFDQDIYPERDSRQVTLAISAMSVELKRSNNFTPSTPTTLSVNVVTVVEMEPPHVQKPVCWRLITKEPIRITRRSVRCSTRTVRDGSWKSFSKPSKPDVNSNEGS